MDGNSEVQKIEGRCSLLDLVTDPEVFRSRLAELEAGAKANADAKRTAEAAMAELTSFLKILDGELGRPLRDLALEIKRREAAATKQETRVADMERRLADMRKLVSEGAR